MNFEYLFYYVITAFGQTATTFTSQNHAAGMPDRCARIFRLCLLYSVLFSAVLIAHAARSPPLLLLPLFDGTSRDTVRLPAHHVHSAL